MNERVLSACRRRLFVASGIALVVMAGVGHGAEFILTRGGKPACTIVVGTEPTDVTTFAAQELQGHVRRISGCELPIVAEGEGVKDSKVFVGPSARGLSRVWDAEKFEDQEYLIDFEGESLTLVGKGEGTAYAVHDFLERFCDVRWYGPKESQMVYPRRESLSVTGEDVRRRPAFLWRSIFPWTKFEIALNLYEQASPEELALYWRRLRAGGEAYACNHSLEGYYDRFWKQNPSAPEMFEVEHPEWFAQGYSEEEQQGFGNQPPQLCYSHPGLVAQVVADARKYFDGEGAAARAEAAGNFFAMVPMDRGGRVGWCRCEECQKQIDQERLNENLFDSNGSGSDYWFGFVNQVAREIAKSHPEKTISTLAYAGYSYRPRKVVLEPNVSVQMCLHTRNCWAPGMTEDEERWSEEWVREEKGRKFYLWLYHCLPELQNDGGPPFRCFPGFHAHRIDAQFKRFARMGIRGAFIEGVSDQVDAYVTMKLLDDPAQDVEGMLEEFFARYYGGAAKPMKEFYTLMEEIYCDPGNYPEEVRRDLKRDFFQTEEIAWRYLGTEERMARLGALMDEATGLASNEVERQRVLVFRQGVWDHMLQGRSAAVNP